MNICFSESVTLVWKKSVCCMLRQYEWNVEVNPNILLIWWHFIDHWWWTWTQCWTNNSELVSAEGSCSTVQESEEENLVNRESSEAPSWHPEALVQLSALVSPAPESLAVLNLLHSPVLWSGGFSCVYCLNFLLLHHHSVTFHLDWNLLWSMYQSILVEHSHSPDCHTEPNRSKSSCWAQSRPGWLTHFLP